MSALLHVLQHALGLDEYGRPPPGHTEPYRNYCCAEPGDRVCEEAEKLGLMRKHPPSVLTGGDDLFTVTDAGKAYVREHSPRPPKLTRSQARYRAWLDADCGATFGEWLKARWYEART